jgi:Trypsin
MISGKGKKFIKQINLSFMIGKHLTAKASTIKFKTINNYSYNIPSVPHNDLGIVRVDRMFEFSKKVQPIKLFKTEVPEGELLRFTGFGQQSTKGNLSNILRFVDLKQISLEECNNKTDSKVFGAGHLCTFNDFAVQGICHGDK